MQKQQQPQQIQQNQSVQEADILQQDVQEVFDFQNIQAPLQQIPLQQQVPQQFQQMQYQQQAPQQFQQMKYQQQMPQQQLYQQQNTINTISRVELTKEDLNLELGALIVTIREGSSYDSLFTTVPQQGAEGTRIRVYQTNTQYLLSNFQTNIAKSVEELQKDIKNQQEKEFYEDIKKVDPENIIFNWECSSSLGDQGFTVPPKQMFELIKFFVDKQYYLMFSDFSLKALIATWQSDIMGPNPFKKVGECSSSINLRFDPEQLKKTDSAQLVKVGELCDKGHCNVHLMGGTILYSVEQKNTDHDKYQLELLTVADRPSNINVSESQICQIGENKGIAGHVVLNYPSGGKILTSMGHWVELMQLDTSEETLLRVAQDNYGVQYQQQMQQELEQCSNLQEKQMYVQTKAAQFVQQSAPCKSKKMY